MFACCCKKRKKRDGDSNVSHRPLCNQDSGAISVPVNRLDRNLSQESNASSHIQSGTNVALLSGTRSLRCESPDRRGVQRSATMRETTGNTPSRISHEAPNRGSSIYRHNQIERLARESGGSSGLERSGSSRRTGDNFRNSALETAICRFGRRYDDDEPETISRTQNKHRHNPKSRDSSKESTTADGFTLSLSFEGGLDQLHLNNVDFPVSLKVSSHDNRKSRKDHHTIEVMEDFERKHSLYDNVDDVGAEERPLYTTNKTRYLEPPRDNSRGNSPRRLSPSGSRRSSYTMPLRFTMFNGGQYSEKVYDENDSIDQDYVNLPMDDSTEQDYVNIPNNKAPPVPEKASTGYAQKKSLGGSKPLKVLCTQTAPVVNRIEKQVLAFVPIFGEPTPQPKGKRPESPLDKFCFPPPPTVSPPILHEDGNLLTCINPMYSPTTATPACDLETANLFNQPNAYFSF